MTRVDTDSVKPPPKLGGPPPARAASRNLLFGIAGLCGLAVLFLFNPAEHFLYPRCAFNALTGLLCPGCGGLRAMHQLLHGHVSAAWALNPLAVLLLPACVWFGLDQVLRFNTHRRLPMPRINGRVALLCLAGLMLFGILRNLW